MPFYQPQWNSETETQAECLDRLIKEKNPKSIGIDTSKSTAVADGLTKTLYDDLIAPLDDEIKAENRQRRKAGRSMVGAREHRRS